MKETLPISGVWIITTDLPARRSGVADARLAEAKQVRQDADRLWEKGGDFNKRESTRLHNVASEIEDRANAIGKIRETEIRVLVEFNGEWRCIQKHVVPNIDQTISHCTGVAGIEKAPKYEF